MTDKWDTSVNGTGPFSDRWDDQMTDINKLCDELEAELKAIESMPVEDRSFATYECRRKLFYAAQPLIDAARESVKLREELAKLLLEATDYMHAVEGLFSIQPEGDCLAERKPTKDAESYRAFTYLNDQGRLLRELIKELEQELKEIGG